MLRGWACPSHSGDCKLTTLQLTTHRSCSLTDHYKTWLLQSSCGWTSLNFLFSKSLCIPKFSFLLFSSTKSIQFTYILDYSSAASKLPIEHECWSLSVSFLLHPWPSNIFKYLLLEKKKKRNKNPDNSLLLLPSAFLYCSFQLQKDLSLTTFCPW